MTLAEALGVGAGDVVSFIGAGGKTTAMYRVAADHVHRPELVAEQAGIRMGDPITPEAVARVLLGRANLRGKPPGARLAGLITKVRGTAARAETQRLARLLLEGGASSVVMAELAADPPFIAISA